MKAQEIREKFIEFFKKHNHKEYPSSSLIPDRKDVSVLFTSAGMQQFKDWYVDRGKIKDSRVVTIQKCFRTSDIDEVGDKSHHTFFEMLGNFSFGYPEVKDSYFKEEAINLAWQFLTDKKWLGIDRGKITASIFKGDQEIAKDQESRKILEKIGLKEIRELNREENFWGPIGKSGPCGPTVEFFVPGKNGAKIEIWNLVFNQYNKNEDGRLEELESRGVDTGMGLERVTAYLEGSDDDYQTELFRPIIKEIERLSGKKYQEREKEFRIIADYVKAAAFLYSEGIKPSNKKRGAVQRRLVRGVIDSLKRLGIDSDRFEILIESLLLAVVGVYKEFYPAIKKAKEENFIKEESDFMENMRAKLRPRIDKRIAILERFFQNRLDFKKGADSKWLKDAFINTKKDSPSVAAGKFAYNFWNTWRFPKHDFEKELDLRLGGLVNRKEFENGYREGRRRFKEISRKGAGQRFKSGLADHKKETIRLHTAAHLLHEALRRVLGKHVNQAGQNITGERLRFDFTHPQALSKSELRKVENMVNKQIKKGLPVTKKETSLKEAIKEGAVALFRDKYPDRVTLYSIGNFSKELCLGPHVKNTSELGRFKIIKEESSSRGIRRIRAELK